MIELIRSFLEKYGAPWGLILIITLIVVMVFFTRLARQLFLHKQREIHAFLDKGIFTYQELVLYKLVDEDLPVLGEFIR